MSNFDNKLQRAIARRATPENLIKSGALNESVLDSIRFSESSRVGAGGSAAQYARICMLPVSERLTEISLAQGTRVQNQLEKGLSSLGYPATFRFQGSVPMNVHIRTTHDIDLLVLATDYLTSEEGGPGSYTLLGGKPVPLRLLDLRTNCIEILSKAYHAAQVDVSGTKSIAISGGSLSRKVDVVPSCWHDTVNYQKEKQEMFRWVRIVNKDTLATAVNGPFYVRALTNYKDGLTNGGMKRVIRLLKSLKEDSDSTIMLSSFDIVSLVYHFSNDAITFKGKNNFALLVGALEELQKIVNSPFQKSFLKTIDDTRLILDTSEKSEGLVTLRDALATLVTQVAIELSSNVLAARMYPHDVLRAFEEAA